MSTQRQHVVNDPPMQAYYLEMQYKCDVSNTVNGTGTSSAINTQIIISRSKPTRRTLLHWYATDVLNA